MNGRMPTEMQCVARTMHTQANALAVGASQLPVMIGALTKWAVGDHAASIANSDAAEMLLAARSLEFGAQYMDALATQQAGHARHLYSLTIELVDLIRFLRAASDLSKAYELATLCEDKLATLQERIAEQFPGETIVGD